MMEEVNLTKIYCKHIYKYHKCKPLNNYYMLINFLKKISHHNYSGAFVKTDKSTLIHPLH
jgi:hypothetical protein